jgi:hypothetical protein
MRQDSGGTNDKLLTIPAIGVRGRDRQAIVIAANAPQGAR